MESEEKLVENEEKLREFDKKINGAFDEMFEDVDLLTPEHRAQFDVVRQRLLDDYGITWDEYMRWYSSQP